MDWIVTLPKKTPWSQYLDELKAAENGEALNYKVACFPRDMKEGDRLYITWNGQVRGWMTISRLLARTEGFVCSSTGIAWKPGCYIQRTGKFHTVSPLLYPGFRGVRRFKHALAVIEDGIIKDTDKATASAILEGDIPAYSMGCVVAGMKCSVCGKVGCEHLVPPAESTPAFFAISMDKEPLDPDCRVQRKETT